MPSFGFLLVLLGIFILINVINGNAIKLSTGQIGFNFTPQAGSAPVANNTSVTLPNLTRTSPILPNTNTVSPSV